MLYNCQGNSKGNKRKEHTELAGIYSAISVFFCFFVGLLSGGSAFHDAANDYELYQAGHYYLVSHGIWTEVSHEKYLFVLISEIIGFSSLALSFVLALIRNRKQA